MPTSAEDPVGAKRQRGSMAPTEWEKEREWVPLWLAGPLLALFTVFGLTILLRLILWSVGGKATP